MNAAAPVNGHSLTIQLLLDREIIDHKKLREFRTRVGELTVHELIKSGLATDQQIAQTYAQHLVLPLVTEETQGGAPPPELARLLPEKLCRDQLVVPLAVLGEQLDLAIVTPDAMLVIDEIQLLTGLRVRPRIAALSVAETWLDRLFNETHATDGFIPGTEEFEQIDSDQGEEDDEDDTILHLDQPPPPGRNGRVIRMVNQILDQAIRSGASDIHLEPFEDNCRIRLRIDGRLQEMPPMPRSTFTMVLSRFKILAKMDIAEKRIPQDGAIGLKSGERRIDLRVSTVPAIVGEKMVMRLLDKGNIPLDLTTLGLDERQASDLIESIHLPHGLMLVTGPTGSGKSTTLYACLNLLNEVHSNICTVEDPVEYKFRGMNQIQVKGQIGLTFATALRSFLRQDPDIIMVGEVRDQETAEICLRAALTGHFVLSTLHTNDALAAVNRLQDMGIEPFLLASTLRVLEAQRLVRRLCPECKEPYACEKELALRHGLEPGETLYRPRGCAKCRESGYKGRVGVFEVIRITPEMARLIQKRTPLPDLRASARDQGMKLLIDSAIDKARKGVTSLENALSVAIGDQD
ncbi:type IV pilus assembly protein PilB [Singulisphaera sp. GP187]|uniref:GspE/PulE family protein n=1 Tax=Singulisphaera sp. GP187 TaxID=1882752 RepID=UPI0009260BAD|nr:GspE/PulE family protein [Singulisphaera sp. GP187]SIO12622.1 type IV pilus assembly protein PilB [Singulisphaera sp. GP187]